MTGWWEAVVAIVGGVLLLWLTLVAVLLTARPNSVHDVGLREALRLLPDLVYLLRRLAADATVPRVVRVGLVVLIAYLLVPIDVVPDFLPIVGYADDAVIVALALRWVVRRTGSDILARHWPGTADGLRTVQRLTGL